MVTTHRETVVSLTLYQASVPVFVKALGNLRHVLEKGKAHAAAIKVDESVLLNARLFPDMRPLTFQVHVATDMARGCAARLAGQEPPKEADDETTFDQLMARIDRTIDYMQGLDRAAFEQADSRTITRPVRGEPRTFTAVNYLEQYAMPNVYFHCTTAYNLLRHNGVALGKADFLGRLD
jgi:hypothetical protein